MAGQSGGPPVAEAPPLHVSWLQAFLKHRVVDQIELSDREVVRRAPVGVYEAKLLVRHGTTSACTLICHRVHHLQGPSARMERLVDSHAPSSSRDSTCRSATLRCRPDLATGQ